MSGTADACYDAMLKLGVATASGHFSGGNDEGGFDEHVVFTATGEDDGSVPESLFRFDVYDKMSSNGSEYKNGKWVPIAVEVTDLDGAAIADHMAEVLSGHYGGFAGEFQVYGTLKVDATARTTTMSGQESQETWSDFSY